jgi:hypothetical protein
MKPIKSLIILALIAAPGLAAAQGYYGPLPVRDQQGFLWRRNHLTVGFSVGLGYMNENGSSLVCTGCGQQPVTLQLEGHIGGMLSNRLGLMLEIQANYQQLAFDPASQQDSTIQQSLVMIAPQYWILPQLWVKLGIGLARIDVIDNVTGFAYAGSNNGLGLLAAGGLELMSARRFALELQLRLAGGFYSYPDGSHDRITSGTIGLGLNWY